MLNERLLLYMCTVLYVFCNLADSIMISIFIVITRFDKYTQHRSKYEKNIFEFTCLISTKEHSEIFNTHIILDLHWNIDIDALDIIHNFLAS